jgi:hypothetical protein
MALGSYDNPFHDWLRSELRVFVARRWGGSEPFLAKRRTELARISLQDYACSMVAAHVKRRNVAGAVVEWVNREVVGTHV